MAVIVKFDFEEIEKLLREEVARKFSSEVEDIEWFDDEVVEVTLGAKMPPQRGGPGDL